MQAFSNIFGGIKTAVTTAFNIFTTVAKPILAGFLSVIKGLLPIISAIFKGVFWTALQIVKSVWGNIKGVINGALDIIMGAVKIFSGLFTGDFSKMWEGVKQAFSGAVQFIWNFVQLTFFGKLIKGVGVFAKSFGGFFKSAWSTIKSIFTTTISAVWNFFKNRFTSMLNTGKSIFNSLRSFFSKIWSGIKNIFWDSVRAAVDFVKSRFTNLKNNTSSIFTSLRDTARKIWTSVKDNIINPVKNAYSSVVQRFGNLRDKGLEIFRNLKKKAGDIFDDMVEAIKGLPKRMGDGLSKAAKNIAGGVKNVSKFLLEGLAKGVNGVTGGINWILDKVHAPKKLRIPEWEIPAYAKGTNGHPGGLALVSDGKGLNKQELIQTPDGNTFLSPKREAIMNLPKGTSVLDGNSTASLLSGIPAYAKGTGILQSAWGGAKKLWGSVKKTAATVWDFASDPLSLIKSAIGKFTSLGDVLQPAKGIAEGMSSKATEGAKNWIKGLLDGGDVKSSGNPSADVKKWVAQAMEIAGVSGTAWKNGLSLIAMKESGGNPKAQNNWDINAMRGIPSKGLMQTIEPTFNAFKKKGYGNILNPVHNILAAIGYIKSRYKTIGNVPGVKAVNLGRKYVGYENGGIVTKHHLAQVGEGNKPEAIIPLHKAKRSRALRLLNRVHEVMGIDGVGGITVNNNSDTSGLEKLFAQQVNESRKSNAMTNQMLQALIQLVQLMSGGNGGNGALNVSNLLNLINNAQGKQLENLLYNNGMGGAFK
ncbi:transglycosylase SLT domain-containing protein [Terribacillus sp. 7520-G]|uniref:transglycosylase SLT domain-containing protein n=1 Tax=Terribacillus sp. 7520-G TaxID=2025389 RepID=UPI000BA51236|nr:transglycosylase SLT domain-containing protein [Terribacillus sp. 7520-G]PAD39820.1 hypothetical protein CHH53_04050 [Terribacillus sp. 7520-G]